MKLGLIANTDKENVNKVLSSLIKLLIKNKLDFILCNNLKNFIDISNHFFKPLSSLAKHSDILISIGGDGTLLNTAFTALKYDKPVLGVNLGKLGFLAEIDINEMGSLIKDIKSKNYTIEERMILVASTNKEKFVAVNDFVIGKGAWPKMIEITLKVDEEYVSSFSADGLVIATPTGSTGYSLSVGGPVVSPRANVITLSPISAHSLTLRPLVLPGMQKISILVNSQHPFINLNCDGQRVIEMTTPAKLTVFQSNKPLKLIHTSSASYFKILRTKLYWGIDARLNNINERN